MKYAIKLLKKELCGSKRCQKATSSTELKMQFAGHAEELENAIKAIKQHDKIFGLLKRLDKWAENSLSSVSQEDWMKEQDKLFSEIKKIINQS